MVQSLMEMAMRDIEGRRGADTIARTAYIMELLLGLGQLRPVAVRGMWKWEEILTLSRP